MAGKTDIMESMAREAELSKKQASDALDAALEAISGMLTDGERVQISGFGSFSISERSAREGRNPATGETIHIPASKVVRFKPAKALKDAVNG